ncbi:hypothetical protein [Tsukamurella paurometabola]|nr:hypothetical protein [Tsukamurella paurometabola]UEA84922.1 hypothetical protein LK411_08945 [Tsukamurella paurometabola]
MRGLRTRAVMIAEGWTDDTIRKAIKAKKLRRVWAGVYTERPVGERWEEAALTVVAAGLAGDHGVISHQSAAVLHGLPMLHADFTKVHTTVNGKHGGGLVSRNRHVHPRLLLPGDVITVEGLLVTSRARSTVDTALGGTYEQALVVFDGARRVRRYPKAGDPRPVAVDELRAVLDRLGAVRGRATARRALDDSCDVCESAGESWSRARILEWGLPLPEQQKHFRINGRTYFADFQWGHVIGEFDGDKKYDSDAARRRYEKRRDSDFATIGMTVCHWTWEDLTDRLRFFKILTTALNNGGIIGAVPPFPG